jgi:hypothetical protein
MFLDELRPTDVINGALAASEGQFVFLPGALPAELTSLCCGKRDGGFGKLQPSVPTTEW